MINQKTAMDIAYAWREVETAEALLAEISETVSRREGLTSGTPLAVAKMGCNSACPPAVMGTGCSMFLGRWRGRLSRLI